VDREFPKPKWPPIQNADSIDMIGKRNDGGLDLVIVASQPIDENPQTLQIIRDKVRNYLAEISHPDFQKEFNHPPRAQTTIVSSCEHPIHEAARSVIDDCRRLAAEQGVRLDVRK
jgi:hypothetical protein